MDWHAGLAGHVVKTKENLRVLDAYKSDFFNRNFDTLSPSGFLTKSVLCIPIVDTISNEVVAVAQFINKQTEVCGTSTEGHIQLSNPQGSDPSGFSEEDERLGTMLGSHVAIFLRSVSDS